MHNDAPLVIVGASYAGVQLAASAREMGYSGRIVMVGDELRAPYQRPPLSKGLLTGKTTVDQLPLRGEDFYRDNRIELLLGQRVTRLDPAHYMLSFSDGRELTYSWLVLATGARCRPLTVPGADLDLVFSLRTVDDAQRIADQIGKAKRVCVIGGGFIGLEVASALQSRGVQVTVVEAQTRLLERAFPPAMSDYVAGVHRDRGVRIELGRGVRRLCGQDARVASVELVDGTDIACDAVVVGIGVLPNAELAADAGIETDNGILVDACGRTRLDHVLAAGDVASMLLPAWGPAVLSGRYRLESIQAANDGAKACASVIVGQPKPCTAVPWFWSDQFDLKFQMAGLYASADEAVLRGDMQSNRFSMYYLRNGRVAALHSVNRPAEHMLGRRLIAAGSLMTREQIENEQFDLKSILTTASQGGGMGVEVAP